MKKKPDKLPLKLEMPFDEAMRRVSKIKPDKPKKKASK
jgi:hypothetical protein